jgi:hypothetical protein
MGSIWGHPVGCFGIGAEKQLRILRLASLALDDRAFFVESNAWGMLEACHETKQRRGLWGPRRFW